MVEKQLDRGAVVIRKSRDRGTLSSYKPSAVRPELISLGLAEIHYARNPLCFGDPFHIFSHILGRPGPPNQGFGEIW